jgi:hypothetical protein
MTSDDGHGPEPRHSARGEWLKRSGRSGPGVGGDDDGGVVGIEDLLQEADGGEAAGHGTRSMQTDVVSAGCKDWQLSER